MSIVMPPPAIPTAPFTPQTTPPATPPHSPLKTAAPMPINKSMPMKNLPAIPRANSVTEAQALRQNYNPPLITPGEAVYYRRKNGNEECIAWVMRCLNKSFTLMVAQNSNVMTEVNSVDYYDHTDENPSITGDPMAGHHSYGTFRRTPYGKQLLDLVARQVGSQPLASEGADPGVKALGDKMSAAFIGLSDEVELLKLQCADIELLKKQVVDLTARLESISPKTDKPKPK